MCVFAVDARSVSLPPSPRRKLAAPLAISAPVMSSANWLPVAPSMFARVSVPSHGLVAVPAARSMAAPWVGAVMPVKSR